MRLNELNTWLLAGFLLGVFLTPFHGNAQSERSLARKGNEAYQSGNYSKAEVKYKKSLEKAEEFNEARFNLGNTLMRQGRFEEAAKKFEQVAASSEKQDARANAYHNLGNAYLKAKKYKKSVQAYKNALRLNPNDRDTRYNLSYALKKLREQQQKKQQQKNQRKDQKKQNQDKKNQKKKNQKKKGNKNQQNKNQQQQQKNEQGEDQKRKRAQKSKEQREMSKKEINRILRALQSNEKEVQRKVLKRRRKGTSRDDTQKNW